MKTAITSLLILAAMSGVALSDTSERAAFRPAAEVTVAADPVRREEAETVSMGQVVLAPAKVAQIDRNRDGTISFAELLAYDIELDF